MTLQFGEVVGRQARLLQDRCKCFRLERSVVSRNRRAASGCIAKPKVAAAGTDDDKAGAQQSAQQILTRNPRRARHYVQLTRETHLYMLQPSPGIALRNLQSLFREIVKAKLHGIARVRQRFFQRFAFRYDARQCWDEGGEAALLLIGLEYDREGACFVHPQMVTFGRVIALRSNGAARVAARGSRTFILCITRGPHRFGAESVAAVAPRECRHFNGAAVDCIREWWRYTLDGINGERFLTCLTEPRLDWVHE